MKIRHVAIAFLVPLAAGCGNVGPLRPAKGEALPVKPAMAQQTPTADDLLSPPPFAHPDRIDELMKKSAPRSADRFDLPPPDGAAVAPSLPVDDDDTGKEQVETPQ